LDSSRNISYAIIGAGPAGLAAAHELSVVRGLHPVVFESSNNIGGISTTIDYKGNRIDIGGHRFFTKSSEVLAWWLDILPVESGGRARGFLSPWPSLLPVLERAVDPSVFDDVMLVRPRKSSIMFEKTLLDYPLTLNGALLSALGLRRLLSIGWSYCASRLSPAAAINSMEDFYVSRFGRTLFETFFKSYTEKVWGIPCSQIGADWGAQRIKGLSVIGILTHALGLTRRADRETSLVDEFLYPKKGPGQLWEAAAHAVALHGGSVRKNRTVTRLFHKNNAITDMGIMDEKGTETRIPVDTVISSMPLRDLIRALEPAPPDEIIAIANGLLYRDFITAGILLKKTARENIRDNWMYIQEPQVKLGRIQFFKNWSAAMVKDPGTDWLGLEYFCNQGDRLSLMTDATLRDLGISELVMLGLCSREDVLDSCVVRMPKAYPVYAGTYHHLPRLREYLDGFKNLYLMGRNGLHRYNNQDHSVLAGLTAARLAAEGKTDKTAIWEVNTEQDYYEKG